MNSATTPQDEVRPRSKQNATNRQIRGSSLMLVGRALSMGVNFAVQVLIVRYFANAKAEYGAFAFALLPLPLHSYFDKKTRHFLATTFSHGSVSRMSLVLGTALLYWPVSTSPP